MNGVGPSLYLAPPVAFTSCHCPLSPAMIIPILLLRNSDSERLSNLSKVAQHLSGRQDPNPEIWSNYDIRPLVTF